MIYPLSRLTKVSSEGTQWEEAVAMEWEEEVMAWEEVLGWVVAMAWEEVVMEWEDLQEESEAPVLEAWRLVLETGSAWNARMSTSHGVTSAISVRSQKAMQCPSSRALGLLGG